MALADFGATWLWLPVWRDRGGLLLRLVTSLTPIGALLGALLAWALVGSYRLLGRRPDVATHRFALLWACLAAPALRLLAVKLCSGGMMSRLSYHGAIEWGLSLLLPAAVYATLRGGVAAGLRIESRRWSSSWVSAGLLAVSFLLSKLNQTVLPNLYDYLHAALAFSSWLSGALGLLLLAYGLPRAAELRAAGPQRWLAGSAAVGLGAALAVNAVTLDLNLNVRVAMFDPRSPTSRTLLAAANPLLRKLADSVGDERRQPPRGRQRADVAGLHVQEGAHILLVTIDALRADHLGAYGYARPVSPGLDTLAADGWLFRRAYAQAPHSSYSLSSLHTSEYLHEVVDLGRPLPTATLASTLRDSGYHTAAFYTDGIFHTEGHRLAQYRDRAFGFALFDHTNYEAEKHTDRVLVEADRILEQGEPPSLLWVHYFDVHEPYEETTFGTSDLDRYDSEIKHVDRELTRLISELDRRFSREMVIAVSADHGEEFREHGGVYHGSTLFDEQVRVPLIFRMPGAPAREVAEPVEVIDIAPTLLGMVGVAPPSSMRGRDLRARAEGRTEDASPVFSAVLTKRMAVRYPLKLIADLRFGLFELYDLGEDPHERKNLAQQRPDELKLLRSDIYQWLDSLEAAPNAAPADESGSARALSWGRLGDRRAVEPMGELLLDESAPLAERIEAGQILARLADESSAPNLVRGLRTRPEAVAAEAAIALGRMYDLRARDALARLVHAEDPHLRARAAVSLGRLRDPRAVPALIDALWVAPSQYEREEAVRWLGRLRDPRAVEPLISVIPEFGLRYLVAVALGQIGDTRAFGALSDLLSWELRTNIRDEVVRGLGLLGDPRAVALLLPVLAAERDLKNTAESLVRLGALEAGALGGTDIGPPAAKGSGLYACESGPLLHDWNYLQRTFCRARTGAQLALPPPELEGRIAAGAQLIVRMRRDDSADASDVQLTLAGERIADLRVDGNWTEHRIEVAPALLAAPAKKLRVTMEDRAVVLAIDHALLLATLSAPLAEVSESETAGDAQSVD